MYDRIDSPNRKEIGMKRWTKRQWLERVREISTLDRQMSRAEVDLNTQIPDSARPGREQEFIIINRIRRRLLRDTEFATQTHLMRERATDRDFIALCDAVERKIRMEQVIPDSLQKELDTFSAKGPSVWGRICRTNDAKLLNWWLGRIIKARRAQAECIGFDKRPFDGIMNLYARGLRTTELLKLVADIETNVPPLIRHYTNNVHPSKKARAILNEAISRETASLFADDVLIAMGVPFHKIRRTTTGHALSAGHGSGDATVASRTDYRGFWNLVGEMKHETGHALYELGFDPKDDFTPLAESISVAIHETQSRGWEVFVGHSRAFWQYFFPRLQCLHRFSGDYTAQDMFSAVNMIRPGLIRLLADPVSYLLHVVLRVRMEIELVEGALDPSNVIDCWSDRSFKFFRKRPNTLVEGPAQDMHWFIGEPGYFQTYLEGDMGGAQLMDTFLRQHAGVLNDIARYGQLRQYYDWLGDNVHRRGARLNTQELFVGVTGRKLSSASYFKLTKERLRQAYQPA